MKLVLILVAIAALIYFAFSSLFNGGDSSWFRGGLDKVTGSVGSGLGSVLGGEKGKAAVASQGPSSSKAPAVTKGGEFVPDTFSSPLEKPIASRRYSFGYRQPPSSDSFQFASTLGVAAIVDVFTRSVTLLGPPAAVDTVYRYCEEIDTMGGSCSMQAYAVYVDRSVQKGFDLIAAIGAIAETDTKVGIGNGMIKLDINTDNLEAALRIIADGTVVEVLQRPHVHLEQGSVSLIESLQEVPIPETSVSQGIAQTSINYRKVGLQLEVEPYFLGGDKLRLKVRQQNGIIGREVEIDGNSIPIIETQTVSTTAELSIGQAIVLGGVATYRQRLNRGLFSNVKEIQEGNLYVILATSSVVPRAIIPVSPLADVDFDQVPSAPPLDDPREWIDDNLLPPKNWRHEEKQLIDSKSKKSRFSTFGK